MKIAAGDADAFARAPDSAAHAVLVYGPDNGLVRERADCLTRAVAEDLADPFRVAELSAAQLQDDPARLGDEAAALSLTGGRRVVRLRDAGDALAATISEFLAAPLGDALVVVEGGDLPARSSLRELFEGAANGAALPCYRDDSRALMKLIRESLSAAGLEIAPEALDFLVANLGGDRQLTRRELEKLVLYKGEAGAMPGEGRRVELDDVLALVGDSAALTLDDLAFALADGDLAALERSMRRGLAEGAAPVSLLRAAARHLVRLHVVAGMAAAGSPMDDALRKLRPPVFWKLKSRFLAQAGRWSPERLARALARLVEAESESKRSGAPAEALAARALMEVAANAPRAKRAPSRPR